MTAAVFAAMETVAVFVRSAMLILPTRPSTNIANIFRPSFQSQFDIDMCDQVDAIVAPANAVLFAASIPTLPLAARRFNSGAALRCHFESLLAQIWRTSLAFGGGMPGEQGPVGPAGIQGEQGDVGPTGPQGATGAQGNQGAQGAQGTQGPKGDTGSTGATGPVGLTGSAGATGVQGPKGDTGAQGPQGATGPQGTAGATGNTGPAGDQGATGPTGATGPAGVTGYTSAGAVTGLKEWMGTATVASNGTWSADISAAGFASVTGIWAAVKSVTNGGLVEVTSAAATTTLVSGTVQGLAVALGILTLGNNNITGSVLNVLVKGK